MSFPGTARSAPHTSLAHPRGEHSGIPSRRCGSTLTHSPPAAPEGASPHHPSSLLPSHPPPSILHLLSSILSLLSSILSLLSSILHLLSSILHLLSSILSLPPPTNEKRGALAGRFPVSGTTRSEHQPFRNASAPETISMISVVMAAWRAWLYLSFRLRTRSLALRVAFSIAVICAP